MRSIWRLRDRPIFHAARPWLAVSGLLFALIAFSFPVSVAHGTPVAQWLRDAATYGLFAAAPVFALDAATSKRRGLLLGLLVAFASLGALSFAMYWVSLRNLAALPFSQLVLPTGSLPTVLFLVAMIIDRPRRLGWIILAGATLGLFLVTGTRSALLIVAAIPIMIVMAGRPRFRMAISASIGVGIVAAVFVIAIQAVFVSASRQLPPPIDVSSAPVPSSASSQGAIGSTNPAASSAETRQSPDPVTVPRPVPIPDKNLVWRIQDFLSSPLRDGSVQERLTQYGVAWDLFVSSPLVGVGLGHPFPWTRLDGSTRVDFTADTPLVLPAKLGILGLLWLAILAVVWLKFVGRLRRLGTTIPGLVMGGWAAVLVVLAWTNLSLEDKGFSFALMLVLALGMIELDAMPSTSPDSEASFRDDRELVSDAA